MHWDPFQRAALQELGYTVYRPLADGAQERVDIDEAMLARLARAASTDVERLYAHPDVLKAGAVLRGNARAKRALWPQLRALRRSIG